MANWTPEHLEELRGARDARGVEKMTEDEAKTKWCPMVRVYGASGSGAYNRLSLDGSPSEYSYCFGSDCMMWVPEYGRWNETTGQLLETGEPFLSTDVVYEIAIEGSGHCGLVHHG